MMMELSATRKAFTLIELLITISLIIVLVSILTLALSAARTAAQVAETQSRLTALSQATVRFKDDVGYYPAVLDTQRNLAAFPEFPTQGTASPQQTYRYQVQEWHSVTSPAEFLVGYGNREEDGYGRTVDPSLDPDVPNSSNEIPRLGIRHPSMDGVWRATDVYASSGQGLITDRSPSPRGKLYGPYLEVENEQMLGRLAFDGTTPKVDPVTGQYKVFYPGDPGYDVTQPMVIVDTWGVPIRYYRALYPNPTDPTLPKSGIARVFPQSNSYDRPMLSDFILLRPFRFDPSKVIDTTLPDYMDGLTSTSGDTSTSIELQTGQFAYFSAGPDQVMNKHIRADYIGLQGNTAETDEANEDNLVEVGP